MRVAGIPDFNFNFDGQWPMHLIGMSSGCKVQAGSCWASISYHKSWILMSPFLLNNELLISTGHEKALVVAFNYLFQNF